MFDDRQSVRIGAATFVLGIVGVMAVLLIDCRDVGPSVDFEVFFSDPGALTSDASVQLGGREIGRVRSIRLVSAAEASDPSHPLHPRGGVAASVRASRSYRHWLRSNGEIFVNQKGIIGETYLEVTPPPADQELGPPIDRGARIRGIDPARMQDIVVYGFENAQRFRQLLEELSPYSEMLKTELATLRRTLDEIEPSPGTYAELERRLDQISALVDDFSIPASPGPGIGPTFARARALAELARIELGGLGDELEALRQSLEVVRNRLPAGFLDKLALAATQTRDSARKLDSILGQLDSIFVAVKRGQGTIGALTSDAEFMDDAKKLGRYLKRHPWLLIGRPKDE